MNISSLQILLQESIDNTTSSMDYLLLSKAIQSLNMGQIRSVAAFTNLPTASSNEGLLVFVEADERLYWSDGVSWYGIATDNEGRVWSWGFNTDGQLGNNTVSNTSSPVSIIGGFTDWCQVSAGIAHSLGVRSNGTAWAWGCNSIGQLGNNTIDYKSSPVSVVGGFTNWYQVSAGGSSSFGLRSNGTAWAWGKNTYGQLGDGTTTNRSSPVSVIGGFTDWCQISNGGYHTVGVRTNGTAWAWGFNYYGQLGSNNTTDRSSPVSVVGGFTDWCQVSAGLNFSVGVRTNGTAWAWGYNLGGQLGDNNNFYDRSSPVSVAGGFTDWCQVSAGNNHSLGVRTNGTAWAWGINVCGQLGDCTTTHRSSPVSVVGGFTNWCQVSANGRHSLGVRTNGTAWSWGLASSGQLGDCTTATRSSPVSVVGGFTDWCQVSAGVCHSLAIRKSNFV